MLRGASGVLAFLVLASVISMPAFGIDETWQRPDAGGALQDRLAQLFAKDPMGKSYALVVGVSDYVAFKKLGAPREDAKRVRDFLRDEAGFDYIVTLTDADATRSRIEHLMETDFPGRLKENDRFLFYFSGHGATRILDRRSGSKRGYLVLRASRRDHWDEMVHMQRVREWSENLAQARHVLFVLDACFSGLAAYEVKDDSVRDKTMERLWRPSSYLMTAGVDQEESFAFNNASLFTDAFLATARGEINPPADGIVSLADLLAGINRAIDAKRLRLGDKIAMTPQLYKERIENNAGEFFFLPKNSTRYGSPLGSWQSVQPKGPSDTHDPDLEKRRAARLVEQGRLAEQSQNYVEAVRLYRLAAEQGNAQGQANLGVMYVAERGGLARDDREAARLYRLAADQGNATGQAGLGYMYGAGLGGLASNDYEAVRLYKLAADQGNATGQTNLAAMYRAGRGGLARDDHEAVRLYKLAADQGDATGQAGLGYMYEAGLGGLTSNDHEAVRLYKLAADKGEATGQTNLGAMYGAGRGGLARDDREAVRLYKLSADQGNALGQVNLGVMYGAGLGGLVKDEHEAMRLYKLSADQGNALGQANLGVMYGAGLGGLVKDEHEAVRLYKLSADQGNALGQTNLGVMYETGRGGLAQDDREAARLYKLSADQGNAFGQAYLGTFYQKGRGGLTADLWEARRWYNLAAGQGNTFAKNALAALERAK